jgi:hypothetical protein
MSILLVMQVVYNACTEAVLPHLHYLEVVLNNELKSYHFICITKLANMRSVSAVSKKTVSALVKLFSLL